MFYVFSKYLEPLSEAHVIELTERSRPSEVFNQLRIAYNQGVKGIENCIRLFVPNAEEDDELFEYIYYNEALRPIIRWTNKQILLHIGKYSYPTLYVNARIINSMLEKLVYKKKLKKDVFIIMTSSLVKNVNELCGEIATEDLPFLPRQPNLDWYSSGAHKAADLQELLLNARERMYWSRLPYTAGICYRSDTLITTTKFV